MHANCRHRYASLVFVIKFARLHKWERDPQYILHLTIANALGSPVSCKSEPVKERIRLGHLQ